MEREKCQAEFHKSLPFFKFTNSQYITFPSIQTKFPFLPHIYISKQELSAPVHYPLGPSSVPLPSTHTGKQELPYEFIILQVHPSGSPFGGQEPRYGLPPRYIHSSEIRLAGDRVIPFRISPANPCFTLVSQPQSGSVHYPSIAASLYEDMQRHSLIGHRLRATNYLHLSRESTNVYQLPLNTGYGDASRTLPPLTLRLPSVPGRH